MHAIAHHQHCAVRDILKPSLSIRNLVALSLTVVTGIALALLVRNELYIDGKRAPTHDEAISLLAANAAFQGYDEARAKQVGRWVPASAWKAFIETPQAATPSEIARGLALHDIHPPLYFWALNLWLRAFGTEHARTLNLLLVATTALALYGFSVRQLYGREAALLVVLLWCVSPQVIRVSAEARQYELLALLSVLLAWQTARLLDLGRGYLIFGALAALVMLTHYHGAFVIFSALVAITVHRRTALAGVIMALTGSAATFIALHPGFWQSFVVYHDNSLDQVAFSERLANVGAAFLGFYGWRVSWTTPTMGFFVIALLIGLIAVRHRHRLVLCFAAIPSASVVMLYLAALSPSHAMGGKYLAPAWPFIAFLHVTALRQFPRVIPVIVICVALLAAPAMLWVASHRSGSTILPNAIKSADRIVLDNLSRGILPRYLWHARGDALVFAHPNLLASERAWMTLLKPGDIIILNSRYTGSTGEQEQVVSHFKTATRIVYSEYSTVVLRIAER